MLASALSVPGFAAAPASAAFRAFSDTSPWNVPAAQKGTVDPGNPFAAQFTSYDLTMNIGGIPPDSDYAKPVFFAGPADPVTSGVTLTTPWSPAGSLRWDGGPIPIPAGAYPAPGTDGHLTIVSADRHTAWEFWRCTSVSPLGITAAVVAQWDLTGSGYSAEMDQNSARGSGAPIVPTSIRAEEAIDGIHHALGLTVPQVSSTYVYTPSHRTRTERSAPERSGTGCCSCCATTTRFRMARPSGSGI
jgi:hypothetical protein